MALMQLHDNGTVILWAWILKPTLGEKQISLLMWFLYSCDCVLSFQNYHELQPEGDPGSSVCSEPPPTLHVSKYSIFDNRFYRAFKGVAMMWNAWRFAVYVYRWIERDWLWDNCGTVVAVATAAHLKWDIHYLPWIIGFLSALAARALAERHAKYAVPFSLHSPNGQFELEAESRAKNKVISLTKTEASPCMTACYSPIFQE